MVSPGDGFLKDGLIGCDRWWRRTRSNAHGLSTLQELTKFFEHLFSKLHNGQVACSQAIEGAIGDGAHGDPHGHVLIGNARDAGEVARLHGLAVL